MQSLKMHSLLIKTGSAAFALAMLSFAGAAGAAPHPVLGGTTGIMVLAGDEENAEVQNLVNPDSDNGTPKDETSPGASAAPEGAEQPHGTADESTAVEKESMPEGK